MKLISLYTGAGGLDLGLEAAGFKTAVAVEMDDDAVVTLRHNRNWPVIHADIHSEAASSDELLRTAALEPSEAKMLAGGPPCQPFSKSGYWHSGDSKRLNDPRARTLDAYLRVLRDTLPEAFLLENVPGMAFSGKSEGLTFLKTEIEKINKECGTNYRPFAEQLNAAEYGVPQTRKRVFVIGHRDGKEFTFPEPTHMLPPSVDMSSGGGAEVDYDVPEGLQPARTTWDAIGHLQDNDDPALAPRGKWGKLLSSIPEGHNYLFHTDRGAGLPLFGWRRRYWSMLLKLAKNRPSWTITAQPGPAIGPFHWKSRRLSSRELCALQTFPSDYEIIGDVRSSHKQVGNAVPSALAEILGLAIRRQFFADDSVNEAAPTLLPERRRPIPHPEEPGEVTDSKYLGLAGDHEEHPGVGKGPGAQHRRKTR